MPALVSPVADERDGLMSYLAHERRVLRLAAYGLTDEQARATPTASALSVGGLVKHAAAVERTWVDTVLQRRSSTTTEDYLAAFRLGPDESWPAYIEVATFYVKEYPKGDRIVDVRFRIAAIYYKYHHFDVALEEFKAIALNHPKHRSATTAAHIVLDIYNIKKDFTNLDAAAGQFATTKDLGDATFRAEMAQISGEIGFKKVESLEAQAKWKEAADSYYKFYKNNPSGPLAEKSLYNAYVSYEKADEVVMSAETSKLFISKFPKSSYSQRMSLALAKNAERQYDFESAQRLYEDFHKKFPKDKESTKALYNAAVFAELLEKNQVAQTLYKEYLKNRGISEEERRAIQISQAKIYRKQGDWANVTAIYRRLARDAKNVGDRISYLGELARQYERGGRTTERTATMNEIRVLYMTTPGKKPTGSGVKFAAEAQFKAVASQREKYEAVKLRFPPEDLLYLLKRKEKLLSKLAATYDAVVDVGVPDWGVAALLEKGQAYENFVSTYRAVKVPASYKGETKDEAANALKSIDVKMVAPVEVKAQEIFKNCVAKAAEFHVANEYVAKCRAKIKTKTKETEEDVATAEPSGLLPQPSYWSTRWLGEGVAQRD